MKLEIAMLVGPEAKRFLVELTEQLDRMEALTKGSKKPLDVVLPEAEGEDGEEDFAAKPKRGKAKKVEDFEEEAEEEEAAEEAEEEEELDEIDVKKLKKKPTKLTIGEVNDAAKACALENGRYHVLNILKKKFKVASLSKLDPSQYGDVIKALGV